MEIMVDMAAIGNYGDTIPSFGGHDPESKSRFGSCPPKSGCVPVISFDIHG